jgi:hypothetical protein
MIDGFRIDVTADELVRHLDQRVRHHREQAQKCARKAKRYEDLDPDPSTDGEDDGETGAWWPGVGEELERRAARHRTRELHFAFLRDRVAMHEIYRLDLGDLRSLEWLPVEERTGSL